jgi:hypothetical protein
MPFYSVVIMEKIVPTDSSPGVERVIRDLLKVVLQQVSLSCLQFIKREKRESYARVISNASSIEDLRNRGVTPSIIWNSQRSGWSGLDSDVVPDIDVKRALDIVANTFLEKIDAAVDRNRKARQAIDSLPSVVGKELHIRLRMGRNGDPIWWERLKLALDKEIRRGGWDIVPDNFGIDAKGDIIPFDM